MHESLFQLIASKIALKELDERLCLTYFEPVYVPKNHIVEAAGKIPKYPPAGLGRQSLVGHP